MRLPQQRPAHLQIPALLVLQPVSLPVLQKNLLASDPLVLRDLHPGSQTGSQTGQVTAQTHLEMAPAKGQVARESIELSFGKTALEEALEEPPEEAHQEEQEEQEAQ